MHQQIFPDREGYAYAESLLQERKKELQALRARRESELIDLEDYSSCRRSLLRAINELEKIVAMGIEVRSILESTTPLVEIAKDHPQENHWTWQMPKTE
jgi:hypothetical protein